MERDDLLEKVNLMVSQVRSDGFKRVAGRVLFLNDADRLLTFVDVHKTETLLNTRLFNELKFKFDSLVKRTQAYEKEN